MNNSASETTVGPDMIMIVTPLLIH